MPPGSRRTSGTASPPPQPPGPLAAGDLLAGRYQLLSVVSDGAATLWCASDEVLARQVAVKVIATRNQEARDAAEPFLAAAGRAGGVSHPGLVRVYDAALETRPGRGNDVAYVISEWVDGQPLDDYLLEVGALAPPEAADLLRQAADALTAAHADGLAHGRVHPRNVLVCPSGRVRITDAAVGSVLNGEPVAEGADRVAVRKDTRDLAAVLYALVTARWPAAASPQPAGELPAAPTSGSRPLSPRQVRAGVPRALDTVIVRGLDPTRSPSSPPLATPAALADATDSAAAEAREQRAAALIPQAPSRLRRSLPWASALVFVGAVGIAGWLLGLAVGDLPKRNDGVDAIVSTTTAPTPGVATAVALDLSQLPVRDFDPPPGDGQEQPDKARNAVDRDASTAWETSRYKTSSFGGLKQGVGLLVDLGKVRPIQNVTVGFTAPGATVELRVADTLPADATGFRTVATAAGAKQIASMTPFARSRGRYWLVWITGLPQDGAGYRVGVSELRFT